MKGRSHGELASDRAATPQKSRRARKRHHPDDDELNGPVLRRDFRDAPLGAAELGCRAVDPARVGISARHTVALTNTGTPGTSFYKIGPRHWVPDEAHVYAHAHNAGCGHFYYGPGARRQRGPGPLFSVSLDELVPQARDLLLRRLCHQPPNRMTRL
jgi:hypothetical protein